MFFQQVQSILTFGLLQIWVHHVSGHGRLWSPPGRSTMWRRGFNTPINYDDNALYCGGFEHQVRMGYKCGVCGDPYDSVRENEASGKYATGVITKTYSQGQKATFEVDLTANHKGYFEFKICPTNNPSIKETPECFDQHPVFLADGSGTRFSAGTMSMMMKIDVVLPANLTCEFCVLQWRYHAGNSWGTDPDGKSCVGCGQQEEFYGCADIKIVASDSSYSGSYSEQSSYKHTTYSSTPGKETNRPQEYTTTSSNYRQNSDSSSAQTGREKICYGVGGRTTLDKWCAMNCQLGYCPATHCVCEERTVSTVKGPPGCRASSAFADLLGYDQWCSDNCAAGNCPSSICVCT